MSIINPMAGRDSDHTESFRDFMGAAAEAARNSGDVELCGTPEQLGQLYGALAAASALFKPVKKTAEVKFTDKSGRLVNYFYAPLANLTEATREGLAANGLCVIQPFGLRKSDGMGVITTMLCHSSGARIVSRLEFLPAQDIKGMGGQTTYLGRYALCRLLMLDGVEDADAMEEQTPSGAPQAGAKGTSKPATVTRPRTDAPAARAPQKPPAETKAPSQPEPAGQGATASSGYDGGMEAADPPPPEEPRIVRDEEPPASEEKSGEPDPFDATGPFTKPQGEAMRALCIKAKVSGALIGQYADKVTGAAITQLTSGGAAKLMELLQWKLKHPDAKPTAEEAVIADLRAGKHIVSAE